MHELPRVSACLRGYDASDQRSVDSRLIELFGDGNGRSRATDLTTAISMAVCRAEAASAGIPLWRHIASLAKRNPATPGLVVNVVNGGAHARTSFDITECMLVVPSADNNEQTLCLLSDAFIELGERLADKYGRGSLHSGMEGGYTPDIQSAEEVLALLNDIAVRLGPRIGVGLDVAANNLAHDNEYMLGGCRLSSGELLTRYSGWLAAYPRLMYLEDVFSDVDDAGWRAACEKLPVSLCVADDYLSTSPDRARLLQAMGTLPSAAVLKLDQSGSVTALLECADALAGLQLIASQRSQETDSDFLAHLAVGIGADYLKAGCVCRERIIKYNELSRICEDLRRAGAPVSRSAR